MLTKIVSAFLFLGLSVTSVHAQIENHNDEMEYEIQQIEVGDEEHEALIEAFYKASAPTPGDIIIVAKDIIAIGEKIYQFLKDNKPVKELNYAPVQVIPKDKDGGPVDPLSMYGASRPVVKKYQIIVKNFLGLNTAIDYQFAVIYQYGASYKGKGKYISNAMIKPTYVSEVSTGYTLISNMVVDGISQLGTEENPVVGLSLSMETQVKTLIKDSSINQTFFITGDGEFEEY